MVLQSRAWGRIIMRPRIWGHKARAGPRSNGTQFLPVKPNGGLLARAAALSQRSWKVSEGCWHWSRQACYPWHAPPVRSRIRKPVRRLGAEGGATLGERGFEQGQVLEAWEEVRSWAGLEAPAIWEVWAAEGLRAGAREPPAQSPVAQEAR